MLFVTTLVMSQIIIATSGNVGVGTNITDHGKLTISNNSVDFVFHPHNKTDGKGYFGMHNAKGDPWINFYHPQEGYNKVRFKQSILSSDSTLKEDIRPLQNATPTLTLIKTYSYYFISDSILIRSDSVDLRKRDYGVLAQEVEKILPDIVDTCNGERFVNYNALIAILIKGFNEQQDLIENQQQEIGILQRTVLAQEQDIIKLKSLESTVKKLEDIIKECCTKSQNAPPMPTSIEKPGSIDEMAVLYQNTPNPFTSNTEIMCYLPESTTNAVISIYNLQGAELKSFPLTQVGLSSVTVHGFELPAGMYLYTLVVDNEIIDTKRMILTK